VVARVIRFFTESWALKLAAVALAILMWMAVRANEPERASYQGIPVQVDLRDPDWQLAGPPEPATVDVTVLGPTGELLTLANDLPQIVLVVEGVNDAVESHVVPIQWVQLPSGIRDARVLDVRPDTIQLRYERLVSESLPVSVRVTGSLPEGFTLARPVSTSPTLVEARGPAGRIQELDSIPLMPVDVSGLRSTTNVPTSVDTTALTGVAVSPPEVNVILRVLPDSTAEAADSAQQPPAS
jgi:YbbR domain-containing protein